MTKTSPAKASDTLRFTLCDDQDIGDMDADPCWCSADVVKPTMKPPCVEPSGRSKSSAASEMDTVRRLINGIAGIRSPTSSVCFNLVHSAVGIRQDPLLRLGIPNLAELRRFLPRQADIAVQSKKENLPRLVALSLHPSDASALLSKHLPRGNEIGRSRSRMNSVLSTLKLRSGNCVK